MRGSFLFLSWWWYGGMVSWESRPADIGRSVGASFSFSSSLASCLLVLSVSGAVRLFCCGLLLVRREGVCTLCIGVILSFSHSSFEVVAVERNSSLILFHPNP